MTMMITLNFLCHRSRASQYSPTRITMEVLKKKFTTTGMQAGTIAKA